MKKFKYQLPTLAIIVMILGIVVAVACLVWNAIRFINQINSNTDFTLYDYMTYIIIAIVVVGYTVIALGAIFNSYYFVDDKQVVLKWGILKNSIELSEIVEIRLLVSNNRLELVFKDESYFVVATKREWYDEFINEIKKYRPEIQFIQNSQVNEDK